jgi:hypothetical protein
MKKNNRHDNLLYDLLYNELINTQHLPKKIIHTSLIRYRIQKPPNTTKRKITVIQVHITCQKIMLALTLTAHQT